MITPSLSDYPPTAGAIRHVQIKPLDYFFKKTDSSPPFKIQAVYKAGFALIKKTTLESVG
ncbi:hypothetical protein [Pseudomonas sp. JAI120]|uniref:hypothetical protein n=1 Tax=Pseudomonas sp. JAI120 TaxID=2723063 RepID=UPI0030D9705C